MDAARDYCIELQELIFKKGYSLDQIFNADETGLNYKMLPDTTLALPTERSALGTKKAKERVTIMTCSNASGSFRLPLMLIGKSAKPRALKNIDRQSLPVYYTNQKSAWMTAKLFKDSFLKEFVPRVKKFFSENGWPEQAVLVLDNAPSHLSIKELKCEGIRIIYSPPKTTSLIQPQDRRII